MIDKIIKTIRPLIVMLCIFFIVAPVVSANEILGIDISISQNPIPCGGTTTVTATIKRAPLGRGKLPLGGIAKLWDYDTFLNDGDDLLDQEHVVLWFNQNTVSFTLRCDSKEGGCELYGPSGESHESGTDIYVSFYEHKSARIYVKCVQVDVDGELAIEGTGDATAGGETTALLTAQRPIQDVANAHFEVTYDASVFEIEAVEIVHPALLVKQQEGFFSYEDNVPGVVSFTLSENITPVTLEGPLAELHLKVKNNPPLLWDTTYLKVKEDSVFSNELDQEINVCLGGAYSVFIAPDDTTPPIIDESRIHFTKGKIVGLSRSVSDDHDSFEQYLMVGLYDEHDVLLAEEFANDDGSFLLERFFWLNETASSKLVVTNGVNLQTSFVFLPETTVVPHVLVNYQTAQKNNTGKPGETIQIAFEILGRSDTQEVYSFTVSDTQGWDLEQSVFTMMLDPMENKTIAINMTIPASAQNGTINTITLTMASQTYTENSDADSVVVSVFGTYDQPIPDTETPGTPGFQLLLPLIAAAFVILLIQRKKRYEP